MLSVAPRRVLTGLLVVWFVVTAAAFASKAATGERIVRDPNTGVALYGYDPVAYFIEKAARTGEPQYEFSFGGLVWRFRSEANRAAFMHSPDTYMPAFGGYDPIAVAGGVPLEGHPAIFTVHGQKLFLFSRDESLTKFLGNPENLLQSARKEWPSVEKKLVP